MQGRPTTKKKRNFFTLQLFRKLFESEAEMLFGEGETAKYLSVPLNLRLYDELKNFDFKKLDDDATKYAENLDSRVFARPGLYELSDDMLDKAVKRLSFYGQFNSFGEFENHYSNWSKDFDHYIESKTVYKELDNFERSTIKRLVNKIANEEEGYLILNGILENGRLHPNIIRLEEHVIYEIRHLNQVVYDLPLISFISNGTIITGAGQADPKIFVLVNRYKYICGRLTLLPMNLISNGIASSYGNIKIHYIPTTFNDNSCALLIEEIVSLKLVHLYTLICRLPNILEKLDKTGQENTLFLCAKQLKFRFLEDMLNFKLIKLDEILKGRSKANYSGINMTWTATLPKDEALFMNNYTDLNEAGDVAGLGINLY